MAAFGCRYTGGDGTTSRILTAVRPAGGGWDQPAIAIDAGFAGDSDCYGAATPCVVKTPGGYLMVYEGSDGKIGPSSYGHVGGLHRWDPQAAVVPRGPEDAGGATLPCLLLTGELVDVLHGISGLARRPALGALATVSQTGASWDRVRTVLEPERGEIAVSRPCALEVSRTMYTFFASDVGGPIRIAMATSSDGLFVGPPGHGPEAEGKGPDGLSVQDPCMVSSTTGPWESGARHSDRRRARLPRLPRAVPRALVRVM